MVWGAFYREFVSFIWVTNYKNSVVILVLLHARCHFEDLAGSIAACYHDWYSCNHRPRLQIRQQVYFHRLLGSLAERKSAACWRSVSPSNSAVTTIAANYSSLLNYLIFFVVYSPMNRQYGCQSNYWAIIKAHYGQFSPASETTTPISAQLKTF